jgi:hypothetical protein
VSRAVGIVRPDIGLRPSQPRWSRVELVAQAMKSVHTQSGQIAGLDYDQ